MSPHEDWTPHTQARLPSERSFGLVLAAFLALLGCWPAARGGGVRWLPLAVAAALFVIALFSPATLRPANRAWMWIGRLLHRVFSPVVTGLLFFAVMTPTGWLYRLLRGDPLGLRFDAAADSYWTERRPPGPPRGSMANQF